MTAREIDIHTLPSMLTALRLPSFHKLWQDIATRADTEGWPAARFLAVLAELRIPRKMGIDSTRSWALIPRHLGQPFHAKVGSWFDRLFHGVGLALTGQGLCCGRRLFACFLR